MVLRERGNRMRIFVVVLLLALIPIAVCAEEKSDVWDDWYGFAELQAGGMWSFERDEFMPYFALPTVGYRKAALVLGGQFDLAAVGDGLTGGIVGLTFYLGNVKDWGIDVPGAKHLGVNFGPVWYYDFGTDRSEIALVLSIVNLSQSEGNAKEQRER